MSTKKQSPVKTFWAVMLRHGNWCNIVTQLTSSRDEAARDCLNRRNDMPSLADAYRLIRLEAFEEPTEEPTND